MGNTKYSDEMGMEVRAGVACFGRGKSWNFVKEEN